MKMPPQRTALVAIVTLLLVCSAAWWWQARPQAAGLQGVREEPARQMAAVPRASDKGNPDPAVTAAAALCAGTLMAGMRERTRQLAGRDDAASQLAYALTPLMTHAASPAQDTGRLLAEQQALQQRAFARARQLDPTHPDIAWLAAEQCFEGPECAAAQQAALQAEPDNAAVWVRAMTWARMRRDDAALREAFRRAAAAPRYDPHRGSTLLAMMGGYAGLPTPAACLDAGVQALISEQFLAGRTYDTAMVVERIALDSEDANPVYEGTLQALCKAEDGGALPSGRQTDCVRIYGTMASAPGLLEQWTGLSQLVALTADAPEGPALRERFRQLQWLFEQQQKHGKQFDDLAIRTVEVETLQASLAKAGRWPPPADWLPEDERSRSLILTGRPPAETKRK